MLYCLLIPSYQLADIMWAKQGKPSGSHLLVPIYRKPSRFIYVLSGPGYSWTCGFAIPTWSPRYSLKKIRELKRLPWGTILENGAPKGPVLRTVKRCPKGAVLVPLIFLSARTQKYPLTALVLSPSEKLLYQFPLQDKDISEDLWYFAHIWVGQFMKYNESDP